MPGHNSENVPARKLLGDEATQQSGNFDSRNSEPDREWQHCHRPLHGEQPNFRLHPNEQEDRKPPNQPNLDVSRPQCTPQCRSPLGMGISLAPAQFGPSSPVLHQRQRESTLATGTTAASFLSGMFRDNSPPGAFNPNNPSRTSTMKIVKLAIAAAAVSLLAASCCPPAPMAPAPMTSSK